MDLKLENFLVTSRAAASPNPPKFRKPPTQWDKDCFLKQAFAEIRSYFKQSLESLGKHCDGIETEYIEIHAFKFVAKVYVHGEIKARCKFWRGGISGTDSIAFSWGNIDFSSDNNCNGWVCVEDDGVGLSLVLAAGGLSAPQDTTTHLTIVQAAETLWDMFSP